MGFWIRHGILAVILLVLAWFFFDNQEFLLSLDNKVESSQIESETAVTTTKTVPEAKYQQGKTPDNAAAEGLSNFYAKIYGSGIDKKGPKIRNNVIFLPDPKGDLVKILQARELVVRPYRKNWHGTTQSRPFRKKQTLYQKLSEYAAQDGLEIIWWLNKDFIVKDPFRIDNNIIKTAYQVGEAVSGHFPEGIVSYFCYRQRALVFINEAPEYLNEECMPLKPKGAY